MFYLAKALDTITKTKKEYVLKTKDLKCEVSEFGAFSQAATDLRANLESIREKEDCCQNELNEFDSKLENIADKVNSFKIVIKIIILINYC